MHAHPCRFQASVCRPQQVSCVLWVCAWVFSEPVTPGYSLRPYGTPAAQARKAGGRFQLLTLGRRRVQGPLPRLAPLEVQPTTGFCPRATPGYQAFFNVSAHFYPCSAPPAVLPFRGLVCEGEGQPAGAPPPPPPAQPPSYLPLYPFPSPSSSVAVPHPPTLPPLGRQPVLDDGALALPVASAFQGVQACFP